MEGAAGKGGDGGGRETGDTGPGDTGPGDTNTGMQTMVANLVREALKQEIKDTTIKKQRDPEDSFKDLAAGR